MTYTKDNLRQIFQQPFNHEGWQTMLVKFYHAKDLKAEYERIDTTPDDEPGYYIGVLNTTDNYRIGLFYYQIQHGNVARKRVGLRNLVKSFINPNWGEFDAALVVFDSGSVWRLSFVCDIKGENTAAKRFTYVFGESDNFYNTPVGRFDALQRNGISFENIKDAFSVEALSKEFFDEYREHYADIVEYITGKRYVKEKGKWVEKTIHEPCHEIFDQFVAVYKDPEKTVRDYIKKLMGRLVFLQFLQKKEWMGVPSDRQDWKGGDTRFLQNKFNEFADKDNFIDGFLEPLFNDLNTNRQDNNDLASPKVGSGIKIPFLNGGLFQLDEEDCSNIRLPQHLLGDVLDFFERYNFTIDENDPNDAQIGVDPEMLGRVFENLLEDNKDKGAFYTPKEIVQYMCQESLIAYLQTGIDDETDKESIRQFVLTHEVEHLGSMAEDISIKLLNVKICDPAIGSGAFPMGLLRQLYLCQCAIHPELEEKNAADIKRHIIQNNIYGVDIEKGAVDIARLRFWLSLIVDEESPRFLPNLDFKIMQGNSLLEQYKGVDLSKMTELKAEKHGIFQTSMFDDMLDVLRLDLRTKLDEYYNCSDHQRKENLKQEIIENVKQQLYEQRINVDFGDLDLSANDQFTLWHTWFYDVFSQGGFDIVIGNPPYVLINKETYKSMYGKYYFHQEGKIDLYRLFIEKGIYLCSAKGCLSFITPNTFLSIKNCAKLRRFMLDGNSFVFIDNYDESVFEASVNSIVFLLIKYSDTSYIDVHLHSALGIDSLKLDTRKIKSTPLYEITINADNSAFLIKEKMQGVSSLLMDIDGIEMCLGAQPYHNTIHTPEQMKSKFLHSDFQLNDNYVRDYGGKHFSKYIIDKVPSKWIDYSAEFYTKPDRRFFDGPRIVVREIPSKTLICAYVETFALFNKSVFNIRCSSSSTSLKYLLAILNSKAIGYYTASFGDKSKQTLFPRVSMKMLKQIPIPISTFKQQQSVIALVDEIIEAKKINPFANTDELEDNIDYHIYHLYGLTYDEILIVDPETSITREEYEKKQ